MSKYSTLIYNYNRHITSDASLLKKAWVVVVIFLFVYNFPLNYFGIPFSSSKLVTVFAVGHLFLRPANAAKLLKNNFYRAVFVLTIGTLLWIFFFQFVIHMSFAYYKYAYVISLFYIDCFLGALYIINFLRNFKLRLMFDLIITTCVIQSLIMTLAIGFPPLKIFVFNVLNAGPGSKGSDFSLEGLIFRGIALASDRKIGLGCLHAIACNLILFILIKGRNENSIKNTLLYGVAFLVTGLGGMLGSRTFFVAFAVIFTIYILLDLNMSGVLKFIKFLLISGMACFLLLFVVMNSITDPILQKRLQYFNEWAFEFYYKYEQTGELRTDSSDDLLKRHYAATPEDTYTWLLGAADRKTNEGTPIQNSTTDSGYLITIFYIGILGSIGIYLFWPVMAYLISLLFRKDEKVGRLALAITVFLFILHFKLEALIGSFSVVKVLFLLFVFGVERRYELRKQQEILGQQI